MIVAMLWFLPFLFATAAAAAFTARWAEHVHGRRMDVVYAQHRALILDLRAKVAADEARREKEAVDAAWAALGTAAAGIVAAFRQSAQPIMDAAKAVTDAFAAANRPPVAAPRDPRVAAGFPRRGR